MKEHSMIVRGYRKEFCRPPNPAAQHLRCVAHLDGDIGEVLPYLNTLVDGHQYFNDPPSLTVKLPGKLATLYSREIAINILKDEAEADEILEWLMEKLNEAWSRRGEIKPSFGAPPKPRALEVLKRLPKTNCGQCGHPTCMVFAVRVCDRAARLDDCPFLEGERKKEIQDYLERLHPGL
jgi:ArsR family metal-binding transcriptional regulator